eukprot:Phypoly_transcript_09462.p1 GENE.Phypoly_transcript_09462~~Phypoly_transcript_09462.p1  ORF type:complete len:358 (+),score=31.26 Phypoly_transcript_09462:245-1318(+)
MNPLWFIAGAASVTGILLATYNVQSRDLAEEWGANVPTFFCKAGNNPAEDLFRIAGENFPAIVIVTLLFMLFTKRYISFVPLKVLAVTAIIYTLTVAIIGYMRLTTVPQFQQICATLASRTQSTLQTEAKDLIVPFLDPGKFLPEKPFTDDLAMRTYAVIYPHLAEYFYTVDSMLPYAYLVLGVLLEFRPIKQRFWQYLPVIGAIASFGTMAVAQTSESTRLGPYDLLLHTILQYAIFYLATFFLLAILVVLFRLGMRRVSVLSLFFLISRLHVLGMPALDFHTNMVLIIFLIALIVTTCEFSPGAFVLYALAAYVNDWSTVEWGIVVMLMDNFVYHTISNLMDRSEQKSLPKAKRD